MNRNSHVHFHVGLALLLLCTTAASASGQKTKPGKGRDSSEAVRPVLETKPGTASDDQWQTLAYGLQGGFDYTFQVSCDRNCKTVKIRDADEDSRISKSRREQTELVIENAPGRTFKYEVMVVGCQGGGKCSFNVLVTRKPSAR